MTACPATARAVFRVLLALSTALPSVSYTQQPSAPARVFPSDSVVLAIIKQHIEERRSAGIAVGMLDADGRSRIVAFGDPGPGQPPLDGNSVFEIGSISKVFTSTVLAQMVLEHKLTWDDPVQKFTPAGVQQMYDFLSSYQLPRDPGERFE